MKKLRVKKAVMLRWMIAGFIFSMCGVLMQIIAPEFPESAVVIGAVFFALMLVFGAAVWKLHSAIREERTPAVREETGSERKQRAA